MPRLKPEDTDFDLDELEEAEYTEGSYTSYDGKVPPNGTIVGGNVKKMWWTRTQNDDPMIKMLFQADDSTHDGEYEDLPVWENMALTAGAKFKWAPFLDFFGLTLKEVKTKTFVADEDDPQMGAPILKVGTWEVDGEESFARIVVKRERYDGNWQAHVGEWLPYDPSDDVESEEEPEEPEEERPTRGRRGRGGGSSEEAGKAPARTGGRATPRGARTARSAPSRGKSAPASRGRRGSRAQGDDQEPPF